MTGRFRLVVGALVAVALLGVGGSLIADGQPVGGVVVASLGVYRAFTLVVEGRRTLGVG